MRRFQMKRINNVELKYRVPLMILMTGYGVTVFILMLIGAPMEINPAINYGHLYLMYALMLLIVGVCIGTPVFLYMQGWHKGKNI